MASIDELWLVDFGDPYPGEPSHQRPALVVGPPGTFGSSFPYVFVCPLTTTRRGLSLHVEIEPTSTTGLSDVSYVQCELLRSVNRRRLIRPLGFIDEPTSRAVASVTRMLLSH
jgi:mRNA interferase MazF